MEEEKKLVEQILNGSGNIDKMRKDIKNLVSLLAGFIKDLDKKENFTFSSDEHLWEIKFHKTEARVLISCFLEIKVTNDIGWFNVFSNYDKNDVPLEFVEKVFNGLPFLLKEVLEKIPELKKKIKFLIQASKI